MKSILLIAALLVTFDVFALTLSEAQKIAVDNSPALKVQEAALSASRASLTRLSSPFYPTLGIESRYENFDSELEMQKGGTGNLFAEWNIFNGFQDYAARKAQSFDVQAEELQLDLVKKRIHWEVEASFGKVVALQEAIAFFDSALERNQINQRAARTRRGAGVVSEADVLEFDLFESILRADRAAADGDLKEAQSRLRTLLGESDVQFPLIGNVPRYQLKTDLPELLSKLPSNNVELKTSELNVRKADAEKTVALGGFLPEVKIFASYGSLGLRETLVSPETYAGIVARWELFSGLDMVGARREAAANFAAAEARLKAHQISKKGELEQTYARIKAIEYRLQLEMKNHETAHKYLRTVSDEYRRGVKNSPDLKDANENLLQSHLREVNLSSEYLTQAATLRTLMNGQVEFQTVASEARRTEK